MQHSVFFAYFLPTSSTFKVFSLYDAPIYMVLLLHPDSHFKRYEKECSKSSLIEETSLASSWSYV